MVGFQRFIAAVHRAATRKGLSGAGSGPRRRNLHREAVEFWKDNEALVRGWTEEQLVEWTEQNVSA